MRKEQDLFTTTICQILGKSSDDKILTNLSTLKNTILSQDKQYQEEFKAYNTLEPEIIEYLKKERDKEIAAGLYNQFLVPISNFIDKEDYPSVIIIYRKLTKCLIVHCDLLSEYYELKSNNPNQPNLKVNLEEGREKLLLTINK